MAVYPYVSAQGAIGKAFDQFRKQFPSVVDSDVLKKFGIAPGNESYIISILKFLGLIDAEGKKVDANTDFFFGHDTQFQAGLEARIRAAYEALFSDHGEGAWDESRQSLTTWFRVTDKTSDVIGGRQAGTFMTLAALAGKAEPAGAPEKANTTKSKPPTKKAAAKKAAATASSAASAPTKATTPVHEVLVGEQSGRAAEASVGLTVRIEVNLPASGTPDVYDSIFASVRKHLIDRE